MIQLRLNQTAPIQKAIEYFNEKKPKPSLIVLPTAWGKSILTAYVALNCNDRLLVLQPSKELLEQNIRKYYALCDGFALTRRTCTPVRRTVCWDGSLKTAALRTFLA